jgi:hypothetical protein
MFKLFYLELSAIHGSIYLQWRSEILNSLKCPFTFMSRRYQPAVPGSVETLESPAKEARLSLPRKCQRLRSSSTEHGGIERATTVCDFASFDAWATALAFFFERGGGGRRGVGGCDLT